MTKIHFTKLYSIVFSIVFFFSFLICLSYFINKENILKKISLYNTEIQNYEELKLDLDKVLIKKNQEFDENYKFYEASFHKIEPIEKATSISDNTVLQKQGYSESDEYYSVLNLINTLQEKDNLFLENLNGILFMGHLKTNFDNTVPNLWPLENHEGFITSEFGTRFSPFEKIIKYHMGVDIGATDGTKILAAAGGKITFADYKGDLGFAIIIEHDGNYITRYGHLGRILVRSGQIVKKGDVIGTVGLSGRTTGYHLHFEVRYKDEPIDPVLYITSGGTKW